MHVCVYNCVYRVLEHPSCKEHPSLPTLNHLVSGKFVIASAPKRGKGMRLFTDGAQLYSPSASRKVVDGYWRELKEYAPEPLITGSQKLLLTYVRSFQWGVAHGQKDLLLQATGMYLRKMLC